MYVLHLEQSKFGFIIMDICMFYQMYATKKIHHLKGHNLVQWWRP